MLTRCYNYSIKLFSFFSLFESQHRRSIIILYVQGLNIKLISSHSSKCFTSCSKNKMHSSCNTEMFTVWVSATDWEMWGVSVMSAACPDLTWARHWGNPDNAWPRIWLLNPWHLLVTSYNHSCITIQTGTTHHSTGSNPDNPQSYSIKP